jgi:hypothetical protein
MTLSPQLATIRIARQLKAAESHADKALLEYSKLMTELIEARQCPSVDSHTGQDALVRLARAQVSMIDSSNDLFRTHDAVYKVGRELGLLEEKKKAAGIYQQSEDPVRNAA